MITQYNEFLSLLYSLWTISHFMYWYALNTFIYAHITWCYGFFGQIFHASRQNTKKINAKVIVEHRSTRNNLCCEKVLLSTIFGMVSHIKSLIIAHTTFSHFSLFHYDRNVASHVIPKRISMARKRTRIYGEFLQSHQKFKTQFYTSFCRTSRALYHHSVPLCSFFSIRNRFISWLCGKFSLFYSKGGENWTLCDTLNSLLFSCSQKLAKLKVFISYSDGRIAKMISIFFTSEWMTRSYRDPVMMKRK